MPFSVITATIFLAFMGYIPSMYGVQPISVIWLDTGRDRWQTLLEAQYTLSEAFRWWEDRTEVSFLVTEYHRSIEEDPYSVDICHDRSWAPKERAIYMVAWEPTYRIFVCDGVNVADWADPSSALVWGGIRPEEMTHTIGHLFGALDTHAGSIQGASHDIMDRDFVGRAYKEGCISPQTLLTIGAVPKENRIVCTQ